MTLAIGDFDAHALVLGTQAIAEGRRAPPDARVARHPDGWGLLHEAFERQERLIRRDVRALGGIDVRREIPRLAPGLTVIHARHATCAEQRDISFTHPIERGNVSFFHNGFTPDVAARLGRSQSSFDSAELFEFLVPDPARVDVRGINTRLADIGSNATAANCFIVSPEQVVVVNWFVAPEKDYFTLWLMRDARGVVVASEILTEVASACAWSPLGHGHVTSFQIKRGQPL